MDQKRFQSIVTCLSLYELNGIERRFVERAGEHFMLKGYLTEQQEAILEGIYREKLKWGILGPITKRGATKIQSRNGMRQKKAKV